MKKFLTHLPNQPHFNFEKEKEGSAMPRAKSKATKKTTARTRKPAGKPRGKSQGVKPKPNKDQPMEFRLTVKPEVEVFWSWNAKNWVVWVEAETGKKMAKIMNGLLSAAKLVTQIKETGSVNPNHWDTSIRKHPEDVISSDFIRDAIVGAPGLTHGRTDFNESAVWNVWLKDGLKGYEDADRVVLWSMPAKSFTRSALCELKKLIDIYKAGYQYALEMMGGKGKRKK